VEPSPRRKLSTPNLLLASGAALLAVGGYAAGMALWRAPQEGWPLFAMGGIAMVLLGGLQLQRAWHYRRAGPSGPAFWLDRSDGGQ